MNPFYQANPMNGMFQFIQKVQQIKRDPNQLGNLLMQRGMINEQQAQDIARMGGNYEQIGQYLIHNGKLPNNVENYQNDVSKVQNMMNQ